MNAWQTWKRGLKRTLFQHAVCCNVDGGVATVFSSTLMCRLFRYRERALADPY